MTGLDYWLLKLAPLARDGFRHGMVDAVEVVLWDRDGNEAHLERPSARGRWLDACAVAALGATPRHDKPTNEEPDNGIDISIDFAALMAVGVDAA